MTLHYYLTNKNISTMVTITLRLCVLSQKHTIGAIMLVK